MFLCIKTKNKKIVFGVIAAIALCIAFAATFGSFQAMGVGDIRFASLDWLHEDKKGKIGSVGEFCSECKAAGGCDLKLGFTLEFPTKAGLEQWPFKREIHCLQIVDGVNYFEKEDSYFGITGNSVASFDYADATKPHEIEICCSMETEDFGQKIKEFLSGPNDGGFSNSACQKRAVPAFCAG